MLAVVEDHSLSLSTYKRDEISDLGLFENCICSYYTSKANVKSVIKSQLSSIPMAKRNKSSVKPWAYHTAAGISAYVWAAG